MKLARFAGFVVGAAALLTAGSTLAHHATSTYYRDEPYMLTGVIQEVIWANPHAIIVLQDALGAYWVGEMAAIVSLSQQGLGPDKIPAGMEITVQALPSRDGSNRIHINTIASNGVSIYGSPD